ncbi:MAG: ACT domain-containing protein [Planctomycetaceae bacterium]
MPSLVVTLIGPDRPGLVGTVSDVVRRHEGNWRESRMAHLAGQFAGIVLVDVTADRSDALIHELQQLSSKGLKVVAELDVNPLPAVSGTVWSLNVVANDRPGIVREVTSVLTSHDVNVEELTTECADAPLAGGQIFKAQASIRVPEGLSVDLLQTELERLATDLMTDFSPATES